MSTEVDPKTTHATALKSGSVGVLGIMFFVLSAQAPLTGIIGPTPITVGLGNGAGAPAASIIIGVIMCIFAVGFIEMSRHLNTHGAFYAYIGHSLGRRVGVGAAWIAILGYGATQGGMYGLYGQVLSGLVSNLTGVEVPWWGIAGVTILLVLFLGSRNVEVGARVLAALVLLEFLVLIAFIGVMLSHGGGPQGLDVAGSFSPAAVLSGAPGIAVMFAVASMIGFESTAIYSSEAKDPVRTVPMATYLSVAVVSLFYTLALWMVISWYGADNAVAAAQAAMSGDTSTFVISALSGELGSWIAPVASVLLVTSLLASIMAMHNGVNRYLHSLAVRGAAPHLLARVNRHHAPYLAAGVQSVMAVITIAPFAVLGLDPAVTLFAWGGGLCVVGMLVLYTLSSIAVIVFFTREVRTASFVRTKVFPALATVALLTVLVTVIDNFEVLVGGDRTVSYVLLGLVPLFFVGGILSTYVFRQDGPEVLEPGPFRAHPVGAPRAVDELTHS